MIGMRFRAVIRAVLLLAAPAAHLHAQMVDATSLNNKVMAGYQGWFRAPGDAPGNNGWSHWFNSGRSSAAGRGLGFDTWPDVSEFTDAEKYAVPGFAYADGSQAYLYSALNAQTVLRHFQWMQSAGIDGVWLSEFGTHFPGGGRQESDYPYVLKVMNNVRSAATATGRTWAFMYDMSGLTTNNVMPVITNAWKKMVDTGVTSDARYLHHQGKPVLLVWGFFPDRLWSQPQYCKPMVDFLEAPGPYQAALVGGADDKWRTRGTASFQAMLMSMTAVQPWQVGRVTADNVTGYKHANTNFWAGDIATCAQSNVLFIPVFYSGTQVAGPPPPAGRLPSVPRRNGNFLWEQFVAASQFHTINSVFVAMFDEVNEGTQIEKISNIAPTNAPFLTYEGATSDWYMRLVSLGETMLRSRTPITMPIPISPFDTNLWYRIINKSSGLALCHPSGTTGGSPIIQSSNTMANAKLQWQLIYDGAGYFTLKNRSSRQVLSQGDSTASGASMIQSDTFNADNLKWEFVWDGTGCCKIKGKTSGKTLSGGGATTEDSPILQVSAADSNELRWQIQD
jgi:hypothetical protein